MVLHAKRRLCVVRELCRSNINITSGSDTLIVTPEQHFLRAHASQQKIEEQFLKKLKHHVDIKSSASRYQKAVDKNDRLSMKGCKNRA